MNHPRRPASRRPGGSYGRELCFSPIRHLAFEPEGCGWIYLAAAGTANAIYFLMNIISFAPPGLLCILYRNPGLAMLAPGYYLTRLRR